MRGFRRTGASARSGTRAEASRTPKTNAAQLQHLRRWASAFALVAAILVVSPTFFGFQLSALLALPALIMMGSLFWIANLWAVKLMHRTAPSPTMPRLRVVLAVGAALVVAYSGTFWTFNGDIETARGSVAAAKWDAEVQRLREERHVKNEIVERRAPAVEQDPEVMRLARQLDEVNTTFREAKRNELCELDGTCGTGVPGAGKAYYEKVDYRVQLEREVAELMVGLESAKAASKGRIDHTDQERDDARARVAEIDRKLERLGPDRPEVRGKVAALFSVAQQKWAPVSLVSIGTFCVYLAVDLLAFYLVVRRICRREDKRVSLSETIAEQSKRDMSVQGAKPVQEFLRPRTGE